MFSEQRKLGRLEDFHSTSFQFLCTCIQPLLAVHLELVLFLFFLFLGRGI